MLVRRIFFVALIAMLSTGLTAQRHAVRTAGLDISYDNARHMREMRWFIDAG